MSRTELPELELPKPASEAAIRAGRAARFAGYGAIGGSVAVVGAGAMLAAAVPGGLFASALGGYITHEAGMWTMGQVGTALALGAGAGGFVGAMTGALTGDGEIRRTRAEEHRFAAQVNAERQLQQAGNNVPSAALGEQMRQAQLQWEAMQARQGAQPLAVAGNMTPPITPQNQRLNKVPGDMGPTIG